MGTNRTGTGEGFNLRSIQEFFQQKREQPGINREEDERLRRLRLLQGGTPFGTQSTTQAPGRKTLLGQ